MPTDDTIAFLESRRQMFWLANELLHHVGDPKPPWEFDPYAQVWRHPDGRHITCREWRCWILDAANLGAMIQRRGAAALLMKPEEPET